MANIMMFNGADAFGLKQPLGTTVSFEAYRFF
jgi:hypothetical protein